MRVYLKLNEVLEYATGKSDLCPFERQIGERYETYEDCIYDHDTKQFLQQSQDYEDIALRISTIREENAEMGEEQRLDAAMRICDLWNNGSRELTLAAQ